MYDDQRLRDDLADHPADDLRDDVDCRVRDDDLVDTCRDNHLDWRRPNDPSCDDEFFDDTNHSGADNDLD